VFKFAGILFCGALIFMAGCATQPNESLPPNWSAPNEAPAPPPQKLPPLKPIPSPVTTNPPPPRVALKAAPIYTWTSLNRWAAEQKISAPEKLASSPVTAYAVSSRNGVLVLEIGAREATWNGVEINLGFAPEFIDDQVFVHGLDLQKNLEPLLLGEPLQFSGTNRVIVIDPGHGGDNHGTASVLDGRLEKEFTLDWAKRLKPLLEAEGWKVFLTRTSDVYVTNSDRVVFAEAHHADVFISLHFNSTEQNKTTKKRDEKNGGLETYCITPTGMPSTLTRGFADPRDENLPNNNYDAQNLQLAVRVHSAVLRAVGMEDRGVRRSRFDTVLRGQNRPAILIEGGYLSNPTEAKLIESPEYRQKLAEAVANALK
jgi:N-acetylmuramoyl-L-alanine amidase